MAKKKTAGKKKASAANAGRKPPAGSRPLRIFVGGSTSKMAPDQRAEAEDFVRALAREILRRGHQLLAGCMGGIDGLVADEAYGFLHDDLGDRLTSYWLRRATAEPAHRRGRVLVSDMEEWGLAQDGLRPPEPIALADVAILVAGTDGTQIAANWARIAGKPVLGVARYAGAAENVFHAEMRRFDRQYSHLTTREEFQRLGTVVGDVGSLAADVVEVAQSMLPRTVFPIMSFKAKYKPVFEIWSQVCRDHGYECNRTDLTPTTERITPRILKGIQRAPFVLADISESSPNVFFEIGYAQALGHSVVLTGQADTEPPFDVKDLPVIFWREKKMDKFRKRLHVVIEQLRGL